MARAVWFLRYNDTSRLSDERLVETPRRAAPPDRVNAKVMKDARLQGSMDPKAMPFDVKRMLHDGFEVMVRRKIRWRIIDGE